MTVTNRAFLVLATIVVMLAGQSCSRVHTRACPGQFDPSRFTQAQLKEANIGRIPETGATTKESVSWVVKNHGGWIRRNYPGVVKIEVGRGWGVTVTRDQYGDMHFTHKPDNLVMTTVSHRSDCPDPERGTLLVFNSEKLRVPVVFAYRTDHA